MTKFSEISELKTINDFIRWGSSEMSRHELYFGHGFTSALDEAVYCCLYTLHLPHNFPVNYFSTHLIENERKAIFELIQKRIQSRLPLAYLTQEAWFCGLKFYVDERVLVPRSPMAELILNQFEPWVDPESIDSVLDLCTGSACIAIACQYAFPHAEVSASDISSDAIAVAQKNVELHGLSDDLNLYTSDCFKSIPAQKFDLIVSNPPYVNADDLSSMPLEYGKEPELGLGSGEDGLDLTLQILTQAGDFLSDHGVLIVEVGNSAEALMNVLPGVPFSWLEFENGGHGVFYISSNDLKNAQSDITKVVNNR